MKFPIWLIPILLTTISIIFFSYSEKENYEQRNKFIIISLISGSVIFIITLIIYLLAIF